MIIPTLATEPPKAVASGLDTRFVVQAVSTRTVGRTLIGFGSYSLAFTITYNVQAQAGQRKCSQQTKGVHITKSVNISLHEQQYHNRNTGSQGDGVVRRST